MRMRFMTALVLTAACTASVLAAVTARVRTTINDQWRYAPGTIEGAAAADFDDSGWQRVNLPHTWNATDAFDKTTPYRRGIGWYRKSLAIDPDLRGKGSRDSVGRFPNGVLRISSVRCLWQCGRLR